MKFVSAAHLTGGGTITGDLTISGDLTVSGDSSGAYSEIVTDGLQITKDTDGEFVSLILANESDAADTTGIISQRFDLEDTGGTAVDSGKILVGKEASFTATASTQDSYMALHTSLNGTLAEKVRITSAGNVGIGTAGQLSTQWLDSDKSLSIVGATLPGSVEIGHGEDTNNNIVGALKFINANNSDASQATNRFIAGMYARNDTTDSNAGDDSGGSLHFSVKPESAIMIDAMTIEPSGNVGIGTTAPAGKVSVVTDSDTSGAPTVYDSKYFTVGEGGTTDGNVYISYDQTNNRGYIGALSPSVAWRDLVLQAGGGNVGIGTASPDAENTGTILHIQGTGTSQLGIINLAGGDGGDGDTTGVISFSDPTNTDERVAAILSQVVGTNSAPGGNLLFFTQPDGGAIAERMHINSSGDILFGNGIYINNTTTLNTDNRVSIVSTGSGSDTLYIGNQSITTSSDVRIKENIIDTEIDAISKLNDLRVVDFTWNDPSDQCFNNKNARGKWTGLIAQEVIEHIPYVVNAVRDEDTLEPIEDAKSEDGTDRLWVMEYDKLVPVLIKAVQELSAKVEALEAK